MLYVPQQAGNFRYIDCIHVVIKSLKAIGYMPEEFKCPVSPAITNPKLWVQMTDWLDEVPVEEMQHGDVVVIYEHLPPTTKGREAMPRHCGIVTAAEHGWNWLGVNYNQEDPFVREVRFNGKAQERIWKVYRLR